MDANFFFWWSVVSTIIGILLLCFSIWQLLAAIHQGEKMKAQVKVWMQDANGVSTALNRIVVDNLQSRYSSTNDVCNAVWAIQASSLALYQSLYEERCITEKEYKARQKIISDKLDAQQFTNNSAAALPSEDVKTKVVPTKRSKAKKK